MYNIKRRAALFSQITKIVTEIFLCLFVDNHYVPKKLRINKIIINGIIFKEYQGILFQWDSIMNPLAKQNYLLK